MSAPAGVQPLERSRERSIFDVVADPGEQVNRISSGDALVAHRLDGALGAWIADNEGAEGAIVNAAQGGKTVENLKALGYLQ